MYNLIPVWYHNLLFGIKPAYIRVLMLLELYMEFIQDKAGISKSIGSINVDISQL